MNEALSRRLMKVADESRGLLEQGRAKEALQLATEALANEEKALAHRDCRTWLGELYEMKGRCEYALGSGQPRAAFERGWALGSDGALCELFEHTCFVEKQYETAMALTDCLRGGGRLGSERRFLRKSRVVGYCLLMQGKPARAIPCYERIHSACCRADREVIDLVRRDLETIGRPARSILEWFGHAPQPSAKQAEKNRRFWDALPPSWRVQLRKALAEGQDRKKVAAAMQAKSPPSDEDLERIHWITALALDRNLPLATLAPLRELPRLQQLEARYLKVPAEEWDALGSLKQLRSMLIPGTGLKSFDALAGLTLLEELDAHDNSVATLAPLAKLTNLRELDFGSRSGDLGPLKGMTRLQELHCEAPVKSFEPLSRLSSLRTLHVEGARVADLRGLEKLSGLLTLELAEPKSLRDVSALRTTTGLKKLVLYRAPKVTDFSPVGRLENLVELNLAFSSLEDISWVAGLPSLERVDVGLAKVADLTPLAQCPKLETIDAYRNEGSVAGLSALKALPNLKRLRIRKRGVIRAELVNLQKALPKLEIEQL